MVDEPPAAGKRFSSDLRQIREERDISIDEIHSKTRIARTLIESFEEGRLYSHESYNRVYLRSFVRAYAEAIEIPVQRALDDLDAALEGTYEGGLAEEYVHALPESEERDGRSSAESSTPDVEEEEDGLSDAPSAGGPEGRGGIVGPPRAVGEEDADDSADPADSSSESSSVSEEAEQPSSPSEADSATDDGQESSPPDSVPSEEEPSETSASSPTEEPERGDDADADSPSWFEEGGDEEESEDVASASSFSQQDESAGASPDSSPAGMGEGGIVGEPTPLGNASGDEPSLDRPEKKSPLDQVRSSESSGWFSGNRREMYLSGVGLVIVVVVGVILGFLYFSSESTAPKEESTATVVSDTAAASPSSVDTTTTESQRPPPANVTLGETLHLTVLATAQVENLRIRRDEDLRRPYWIQEGEASVFPFEEQVILQNELGDVQLFLEGYSYPMPSDTTGGIEITRSQAGAFVDTLRGAPASLSVTPDTIPVGPPAE